MKNFELLQCFFIEHSTLYEEVLLTETTFYNTFMISVQLIEKMKMVIKRMRLKALCNDKKETQGVKAKCQRLKSSKTLKQVKDLIPFENDLFAIVQNIRFRKIKKIISSENYGKTFR